jgi:hypothetical protein
MTSQTYSLAGTGSSVPGGGCPDCQAPTMAASGTATCSACIAGKPASGDFAISLAVKTYPPSPCKVKAVSGVLDMTWGDGTTSSATINAKFRDRRSRWSAPSAQPTCLSRRPGHHPALQLPAERVPGGHQPDYRHARVFMIGEVVGIRVQGGMPGGLRSCDGADPAPGFVVLARKLAAT